MAETRLAHVRMQCLFYSFVCFYQVMSPSGLGWCCVVHGMCAGSKFVHDVAMGHGPTMEIYVSACRTSSRYLRSRKGQLISATEVKVE